MSTSNCSPNRLRFLGQSRFNPCFWTGNFLLQSKDCMLEASMLLAAVGFKSIGDPSKMWECIFEKEHAS